VDAGGFLAGGWSGRGVGLVMHLHLVEMVGTRDAMTLLTHASSWRGNVVPVLN